MNGNKKKRPRSERRQPRAKHPYVQAAHWIISQDKPIDPDLVWGFLTSFRYFRKGGEFVTIGIEIEEESSIQSLLRHIKEFDLDWLRVPSVYKVKEDWGLLDLAKARFCTARILLEKRAKYPWLRLLKLYDIPQIRRFELSQPVSLDETLDILFDLPPSESAPFVGIIDDFVNFFHPELLSRVEAVWSQDLVSPNSSTTEWKLPGDMRYGFEHRPTVFKPNVYPAVLRRAIHGCHVAGLACGEHVRPDAAAMSEGKKPSTDNVSQCNVKVFAVHLPRGTVADTSGGSMTAQVLDGLRFIIQRTGGAAYGAVNISYATHAGPHDGTSLLESAIDDLVKCQDGRLAVVFPVGNQYEKQCHARFTLNQKSTAGDVQKLQWHILPDSATPTHVEIWLPPEPLGLGVNVAVTVEPPFEKESKLVTIGQLYAEPSRANARFAVIFPFIAPNGSLGRMVKIWVAPTVARGSTNSVASHGIWLVRIYNRDSNQIKNIDAWVERNDTLFGRSVRGRQSYLVDPDYEKRGRVPWQPIDNVISYVKREGSFSSFGTGEGTVAVGGYTGCHGKLSRVAYYSGGGWTLVSRKDGTDVMARSDELTALHGLRGAGTGAVDVVRMNGTSVAAPQVTRLIVNWMVDRKRGMYIDEILDSLCIAAGGVVYRLPGPIGLPNLKFPWPPKDKRKGFGELQFPPS